METRLSSKGQVVLPGPIRRKLGLVAGEVIDASVKNGSVVLTPRRKKFKARIVKNPITGLPCLDAGPDAPVLTSEQVRELLADFP